MSTKPKRAEYYEEFFRLARAQLQRVNGRPSGDRHFDQLIVYNPTGPAPLESHLTALTVSQRVETAFIDWWTGDGVSNPGSQIRSRIQRWVKEELTDRNVRINDLSWLAGLRTISVHPEAPMHTIPWQSCVDVIKRIGSMQIRSLGQVHDLIIDLMGPRAAFHMIRVLRPSFGHLEDPDWISVGAGAGCGLSWTVNGFPYRLHPVSARQGEALHDAKTLLAKSKEEKFWPTDEYPFTIDTLMMWCEMVWTYAKSRWPHFKDPRE